MVSLETYNDNQWHIVKFNRDRQNATLFVDAKLVDVGSSPGIAQTIDADQPYFLGGISPEVLNISRHNFKVALQIINELYKLIILEIVVFK